MVCIKMVWFDPRHKIFPLQCSECSCMATSWTGLCRVSCVTAGWWGSWRCSNSPEQGYQYFMASGLNMTNGPRDKKCLDVTWDPGVTICAWWDHHPSHFLQGQGWGDLVWYILRPDTWYKYCYKIQMKYWCHCPESWVWWRLVSGAESSQSLHTKSGCKVERESVIIWRTSSQYYVLCTWHCCRCPQCRGVCSSLWRSWGQVWDPGSPDSSQSWPPCWWWCWSTSTCRTGPVAWVSSSDLGFIRSFWKTFLIDCDRKAIWSVTSGVWKPWQSEIHQEPIRLYFSWDRVNCFRRETSLI